MGWGTDTLSPLWTGACLGSQTLISIVLLLISESIHIGTIVILEVDINIMTPDSWMGLEVKVKDTFKSAILFFSLVQISKQPFIGKHSHSLGQLVPFIVGMN